MYILTLSRRITSTLWTVWEAGEVCISMWQGNQRERDHLEELRVDGKIILKWISKKWNGT